MKANSSDKSGLNRLKKSEYNSLATRYAIRDMNKKIEQQKMQRDRGEDTNIRITIQLTIKKMLNDGKSKLEILNYLNTEFSNAPQIVKEHFGSYIEDHAKKIESKNKNRNNGEGR